MTTNVTVGHYIRVYTYRLVAETTTNVILTYCLISGRIVVGSEPYLANCAICNSYRAAIDPLLPLPPRNCYSAFTCSLTVIHFQRNPFALYCCIIFIILIKAGIKFE